jgi:hypothetical protein
MVIPACLAIGAAVIARLASAASAGPPLSLQLEEAVTAMHVFPHSGNSP